MAERRGLNPLLLVVGVIAGAVGAIVVADRKTRKKAQVALEKATKEGTSTIKTLLGNLKEFISDAGALNKQQLLDEAKEKVGKTVKKSKKSL